MIHSKREGLFVILIPINKNITTIIEPLACQNQLTIYIYLSINKNSIIREKNWEISANKKNTDKKNQIT